ncbi:hypothetical protein JAAARDRAFT_196135 [Jaapia argillacea MUCL 33604]|uniref:Uncharacterized protein n=1 Tax=Jaapia argillacea MUCL 33604 TaxID=933084 RepID=A0A067PIH8_9AGAM|nr:hypothetical protein JAAARDRAFT_196135 [Jaapia argillacea MUCL 33604]
MTTQQTVHRASYRAPEVLDDNHSTTEEEAETQPVDSPITEEPEDSHSPTQNPPTRQINPEEAAPVNDKPPPDPPNYPVPTPNPQPQIPFVLPPPPLPPPSPPGPPSINIMSGATNKGPKLAPPSVFTSDC